MVLLDHRRLDRIIKRMAFQVIEKSRGHTIDLIGLNERGLFVAKQLKEIITTDAGCTADLYPLNLEADEVLGPAGKRNDELVVVDDVIYSGSTMFRALTSISELYKYEFVTVAAVVDRGHRKLPVAADIVGLKVPTKVNEHVVFQIKNQKPYQVLLTKNNKS